MAPAGIASHTSPLVSICSAGGVYLRTPGAVLSSKLATFKSRRALAVRHHGALGGLHWPTRVGTHSFMITLVITGHPNSAVALYALTVLLSAAIELSHSPTTAILVRRLFGKQRK